MDRLACVDVAALPLQILLQAHPEWVRLPAAVVEEDRPQAPVLLLNERARKLGVRIGHRYAAALALAPELQAAVVPRSRIDETVRELTVCLRRYSPHVEASSDAPGVFWLDVSGLNRLYPSLHEWAAAVRAEMQRAGMRATVAVGVSRFGTYALARHHPGITVCLTPTEERAASDRVPLDALDLDPQARDRLAALGIHTVGGFLRLPPDALEQRLGANAAELYRLASGRTWAPLAPAPEEEHYERQLEFEAPEANTERLLFSVKRLLDALAGDLSRRSRAVIELVLYMKLDDRSQREERIRPAAATIDPAQLLPLVRLRLNAIQLSSGIVALRLEAVACDAASQQMHLIPQGRRDPQAAEQAFARLRAEFGEDAVVCAVLRDAHLPGARFAWEPMTHMPAHAAARVVAARPLVRRIFAAPAPIRQQPAASREQPTASHEQPTTSCQPPEASSQPPFVFSGAWWRGGFRRDYFFTETPAGRVQWMFYDHRTKRCFLQGGVE